MDMKYSNSTALLPMTNYLVNYCTLLDATDEYTHHSVHVTQPYADTTADSLLTILRADCKNAAQISTQLSGSQLTGDLSG